MRAFFRFVVLVSVVQSSALGCSSSESTGVQPPVATPEAGEDSLEGSTADAVEEEPLDSAVAEAASEAGKAAACASTFGDELTVAFGRIDGTVLAVVGNKDTQCTLYNDDHLVIQVVMKGKVYRMVASMQSSYGDPNVLMLEKSAPLTGPAWSEGWHTDAPLDYVTTLGVHSAEFTAHPLLELEELVTAKIELGAKISVYATNNSTKYASSAHLIHRNETNQDGAIVIGPDTANPAYLLFRFGNQSF